jgi:hypothetical protein
MARANGRRQSGFPDPYLVLVLTGLLVSCAYLCWHLYWPDFIRSYPFIGGDSHDWIANGLYWAGFDVRYSVRPPLLPLVIAALVRVDALALLPIVTVILAHLTALIVFLNLRRGDSEIAAFAVLATLWNHAMLAYSLDVMADVPAACLLALSAACFARAEASPGCYATAGILAGLSAVTQQAALLLPFAVVPIVVVFRRQRLGSPWLWAGAAGFALPPAAWFVGKLLSYGTIGGVGVQQWGLVRFDLGALPEYAWASLSYFGLPAVLLCLAGAGVALWRGRRAENGLVFLLLLGVIAGFFCFFYGFPDRRFLVYIAWPAAFVMAEGAAALRSVTVRRAVLVAVTAWSIMPQPGGAADPSRVTLTPIPPTYLRAETMLDPVTGATHVLPARATLETASVREAVGSGVFARVRHTVAGADEPPSVAAADVMAADSAILIAAGERDLADRYVVAGRLGNLLRKRVKIIPEAVFNQWERPFTRIQGVGAINERQIFSCGAEGLDGSWLVLAQRGSPLVDVYSRQEADQQRRRDEGARAAASRARRLLAAIGESNPVMTIAMVAESGHWDLSAFCLTLLARTTDVLFLSPSTLASIEKALTLVTLEPDQRVDGVLVRRVSLIGQPAAVVIY